MPENYEKLQEQKWWKAVEHVEEALNIIDKIDVNVFRNADLRTNELLDVATSLRKDYSLKVFGHA